MDIFWNQTSINVRIFLKKSEVTKEILCCTEGSSKQAENANNCLFFFCLTENCFISVQLIQANQAGSSSGMEFLAFQKAFTFLLGTGMIIKSFISDRHTSIAKWMREDCARHCREIGKPVVQHFFDIWHIAKSKLISLSMSFSARIR